MTAATLKAVCTTLENSLNATKKAYHTGTPGVTYDDMRAAAVNLLTWRAKLEAALGKRVHSNPASKAQVVSLLR